MSQAQGLQSDLLQSDLLAGLGTNPCVTVSVAGRQFGIPIARVEDVFMMRSVTPVPLAPREVVGLLNLRGKVVTAIALATRLGLSEPPEAQAKRMVVSIGHNGESLGLVVSSVGEVVELSIERREPVPAHFDPRWAKLAAGVHHFNSGLLVELDVDAVLDIGSWTAADRRRGQDTEREFVS